MNGCRVRVVGPVASDAGGPIQFDKDTCPHRLDGDYGNFQVVCKDLDGGTFSVALLGPDETWRTLVTGKTAAEIVIIGDQYHCQAISVTFAALGIGAAAKATLTMMGRTMRYSS